MLRNYILTLRRRFVWGVVSFVSVIGLVVLVGILRGERERITSTFYVGKSSEILPAEVVQEVRGRIDAKVADSNAKQPSSQGRDIRALNPRGSRYIVISRLQEKGGDGGDLVLAISKDVEMLLKGADAKKRAEIQAIVDEQSAEVLRRRNNLELYATQLTEVQSAAGTYGKLIRTYGKRIKFADVESQTRREALLPEKMYFALGFEEDYARHQALLAKAKGKLADAQAKLDNYQGSRVLFVNAVEGEPAFSKLALIILMIFNAFFSFIFIPLLAEFAYKEVLPAFKESLS